MLGDAPKCIDNSAVKTIHPKNKLNNLTAAEWIARTVSVFVQQGHGKGSSQAEIERQHPAPFSYQDIVKFIEMFTKEGDVVLDPFVGVGSTLKACAVTGRNGIGIELNPAFVELAARRLEVELPSGQDRSGLKLYEGDVREIAPQLLPASVGYIVTSPPYWGILDKIDHKARQERTAFGLPHNYGENGADLARIGSYAEFVETVAGVLGNLDTCLQSKRYMTVIVGDFRHKERYFMYHSDLAAAIEKNRNFALKGITVIHQKFKRVFPYGYPHAFVPNIHHQYALTFQRLR